MYYTPDIEEFHVGFEFEQFNPGYNPEYLPETLSAKDYIFIYNIYTKDYQDAYVRVKVLDQKDIEACGWGNYQPPMEYNHVWTRDKWRLDVWFNNEYPILRMALQGIAVFQGTIKNTSELKRIMKQIGI